MVLDECPDLPEIKNSFKCNRYLLSGQRDAKLNLVMIKKSFVWNYSRRLYKDLRIESFKN